MKRIKLSLVSILLAIILVLGVVPASAKTLSSIKKNYDFHYGLDVSTWNDSLNMTKIKNADVEFAIIRIGYYTSSGGHLDVRFKENVRKCAEAGIEFGVYVYSYVYTKKANEKCAKWVHKNLKAMGNYCKNPKIIPVAYDIEDPAQVKAVTKKKISRSYLHKSVCKFCDKVKSYGYIPVVYSFQSFFMKYLDITKLQSKGYKIWYAQWPYFYHLDTTVKKIMYNDTVADIWQFSDNLYIGNKRFDTNVSYTPIYDYNKEKTNLKIKGLKDTYSLGNSSSKTPSFKVYSGSKLLKKNKDYKLVYFKNNRAGTAKIKVIRYKNKKYFETKTLLFDLKPRIPQNIKVKSNYRSLELSWTASKGADYYEIYEQDKIDDSYNLVDISKKNSYTDSFLEPGTRTNLKVRAVFSRPDKTLYSDFKKVFGYTKYHKINIISAESEDEGSATVKWEPRDEDCKGYEVQYSTKSDFSKNTNKVVVKGMKSSEAVIKLKSDKKYYFRVRAYDDPDDFKVYSVYSDVLSATIE